MPHVTREGVEPWARPSEGQADQVARRLKYDTRPIDPGAAAARTGRRSGPADAAEFDDAEEFEGYDDEFGYDDEPEDEEREDEPRPSR